MKSKGRKAANRPTALQLVCVNSVLFEFHLNAVTHSESQTDPHKESSTHRVEVGQTGSGIWIVEDLVVLIDELFADFFVVVEERHCSPVRFRTHELGHRKREFTRDR